MSSGSNTKNPISLAIFGIICLVFIVSRMRFMEIPLDRDEGSYLYMGYSFINGYVPYVDFYEIKPPGIFLFYGLFHIIFGYSNFTLHLGVLLTQLLTAWLVYKFVKDMFGYYEQAYLASSVYLVFNLFINFLPFAVLSEHFFVLCLLGSMYFLTKSSNNVILRNIFISGFLFGFAAMIRQHAIFFVLPMFLLIIFQAKKNNFSWIKYSFYFIAGSLTIILSLIGYVAIKGGFDEMIYWVLTRPSEGYITKVTWEEGQRYFVNFIKNLFIARHYPMLVFFVLGLLFLFRNIILNKQRWENTIILFFFIAGFMTIFPGNRFYGHYWLMLFPFFGMVSGKCLEQIISHKWHNSVSVVVILVLFINQFYLNKNIYFINKVDRLYQALYKDNPNFSLDKVIQFLKRNVKKEDKIFVFGSEPQVYYETQKVFELPHVFLSFLHYPSQKALKDQQDLIKYLSENKPDYVVHLQNPISVGMQENSHQDMYKWIFNFESNNYTPILLAEINDKYVPSYFYDNQAKKDPEGDNYIFVYKLNK